MLSIATHAGSLDMSNGGWCTLEKDGVFNNNSTRRFLASAHSESKSAMLVYASPLAPAAQTYSQNADHRFNFDLVRNVR